jgi:hypothetical protein
MLLNDPETWDNTIARASKKACMEKGIKLEMKDCTKRHSTQKPKE